MIRAEDGLEAGTETVPERDHVTEGLPVVAVDLIRGLFGRWRRSLQPTGHGILYPSHEVRNDIGNGPARTRSHADLADVGPRLPHECSDSAATLTVELSDIHAVEWGLRGVDDEMKLADTRDCIL